MKKIIQLVSFIYKFFLKKKILCLINAPQQYFCLVELIENKKIEKDNLLICIGYCTNNSQEQIKELNKNYYFFDNVFFLQKIIKEK